MRYPNALVALLLVIWAAAGCQGLRDAAQDVGIPFIAKRGQELRAINPRPYPAADIGAPLDIEVIREGNAIVLENRTVRAYEGVDLWLNEEYGATLGLVPVGRGPAISLESFVNRYGEPYPIAKFLRPELDRSLIGADFYFDGKLRKLTVRLDDRWRKP